MDPNANWEEQLETAERILAGQQPYPEVDADRLAELVVALNEWIKGGGFLPAAWTGVQTGKPYSVLLLFPADLNDGGDETCYMRVSAPNAEAAVKAAMAAAVEEHDEVGDPERFTVLLVLEGHHQPVRLL